MWPSNLTQSSSKLSLNAGLKHQHSKCHPLCYCRTRIPTWSTTLEVLYILIQFTLILRLFRSFDSLHSWKPLREHITCRWVSIYYKWWAVWQLQPNFFPDPFSFTSIERVSNWLILWAGHRRPYSWTFTSAEFLIQPPVTSSKDNASSHCTRILPTVTRYLTSPLYNGTLDRSAGLWTSICIITVTFWTVG